MSPEPGAADHIAHPPIEAPAGRLEDFPVGTVRLVQVAGRRIAVGNARGCLFAVDDACLHRSGPLACGHLDGWVLQCPLHWWRYDVRTGARLGQPGLRLDVCPVRVVDGEVRVTVTPAPPTRSWREILLEHARTGAQ
jgi:nitrite reductase/ring-hydroxylating ferredoxin subunit